MLITFGLSSILIPNRSFCHFLRIHFPISNTESPPYILRIVFSLRCWTSFLKGIQVARDILGILQFKMHCTYLHSCIKYISNYNHTIITQHDRSHGPGLPTFVYGFIIFYSVRWSASVNDCDQ